MRRIWTKCVSESGHDGACEAEAVLSDSLPCIQDALCGGMVAMAEASSIAVFPFVKRVVSPVVEAARIMCGGTYLRTLWCNL